MNSDKREPPDGRIVSSRHLATDNGWQLSEYEYGLIIAFHGFSRWMTRCMAAAGNQEMSPLEILVLHHVNHRDRQKRLADIAFLLNVEDVHTVNYALKKLVKAKLITSERIGKEMFYSTTEAGVALCNAYQGGARAMPGRQPQGHGFQSRRVAARRGGIAQPLRLL